MHSISSQQDSLGQTKGIEIEELGVSKADELFIPMTFALDEYAMLALDEYAMLALDKFGLMP